ncbi:type II toxin-antitoxin system VapC family toxin [Kibdelosporangium persicum]|uniref:Nucleic acid-binding protein, contains PIN domain n=1 Tax=Kibdelosporangium persicum TaxID=2698649 RepID=A0ABX2F9N0_9PSEU|nr:PIN domain-containing protein [Kibdelosporangium persicum]NRN68078.1 putative nucleic acid-binding protein, contains PIN domain [Kibdelosporangium persicum]
MAGRRVVAAGTLVLDCEGLSKLAAGDSRVRAYLETARVRGARVVVSAITLAEVLRGGARDAAVHRVLSRIVTVPVTTELGRAAGALLGATGLSGHRCAVDSVVAATALVMARPVVLLTSDPGDLNRLVEEPDRRKDQRVVVVHV